MDHDKKTNPYIELTQAEKDKKLLEADNFCQIEKIRTLIAAGANRELLTTERGYTPIMWAAVDEDTQKLDSLLTPYFDELIKNEKQKYLKQSNENQEKKENDPRKKIVTKFNGI